MEGILNQVCEDIGKRFAPYLLEKPSIYGVSDLDESGVQYTLMALSHPEQYWLIEREMRRCRQRFPETRHQNRLSASNPGTPYNSIQENEKTPG